MSTTSSASAAAALSIAPLSNRLQTICSPNNACLSSPKMVSCPSNCKDRALKNCGSLWILLMMWLTRSRCKLTQPPISRFSGKQIASATGSSSTSVDPSESASSEAATVGDGGATSGSKSEGAGDPSGVKNCSLTATVPSSDEGSEGDTRRGGIGRGNDEDEDVGDGVVSRDSCNGRKMSRLMGSSPLSTAGGRGPFNLIA